MPIFQLGMRELGLEQFLDKDSMEEFDEAARQVEEVESGSRIIDTFTLSLYYQNFDVDVLLAREEGVHPAATYPWYLPAGISARLKLLLESACQVRLSKGRQGRTSCSRVTEELFFKLLLL